MHLPSDTPMVLGIVIHNVNEVLILPETHLLWTLLFFSYLFGYPDGKHLRGAESKTVIVSKAPHDVLSSLFSAPGVPPFGPTK